MQFAFRWTETIFYAMPPSLLFQYRSNMMADHLPTEIELAYGRYEKLDVHGQETADSPLDMTSDHLQADMGQ